MKLRCLFFATMLLCLPWAGRSQEAGFDTGMGIEQLPEAMPAVQQPVWLRLRGMHSAPVAARAPDEAEASSQIAARRAALAALQAKGYRLVAFLRWGSNSWAEGVRKGGGQRMPVDLREMHERCRRLALTYGDLIDIWEFENEPDIGFVAENAETCAAAFKAASLGIRSGLRAIGAEKSRVAMAPLALPPGPYFQRLLDCDLLGHTDVFNYHYYGYAEDFSGVYRQFESAAGAEISYLKTDDTSTETLPGNWSWLGHPSGPWGWQRVRPASAAFAAVPSPAPSATPSVSTKSLPVLLTEYGYGLLDQMQRNTTEGRVRQWAWFRDVERQIRALHIEGPMAFLLMPYYERGINEFGLWMPGAPASATVAHKAALLSAGGVEFEPADFGADKLQPWMHRIGQRTNNLEASPALAWLWAQAQSAKRGPSLPWIVAANPASPIVIDFVSTPEDGLNQAKDFGGYLVHETNGQLRGQARLVVYNFQTHPITGYLWLPQEMRVTSSAHASVSASAIQPLPLLLAAGERREIAVDIVMPPRDFSGREVEVVFNPDTPRTASVHLPPPPPPRNSDNPPGGNIANISPARWRTTFYPNPANLEWAARTDFSFSKAQAHEAQTHLLTRPLAIGEPTLRQAASSSAASSATAATPDADSANRWLATDGVTVEDSQDIWQFRVEKFPPFPLRPAMVELPLPRELTFNADEMLAFYYRRTPAGDTTPATEPPMRLRSDNPDPRMRPVSGTFGDMMEVYVRTENGNLYSSSYRLMVKPEWRSFVFPTASLTMAFWGRAELPWRFADNRPVSLVFFLRPSSLPAIFEIRHAELGQWKRPANSQQTGNK